MIDISTGSAPNIITSAQNAVIKRVRSLKEKKNRDNGKLYIVEGLRFVEEALLSGADIDSVVFSSSFSNSPGMLGMKGMKQGIPVYVIADRLFASLADTRSPQGVLAVVRMKDGGGCFPDDSNSNLRGFVLLLESIRDPGNMGTILRTADAAGISAVIISEDCVDIYNPKVLRSTMGSFFRVNAYRTGSLISAVSSLRKLGYRIYAAQAVGAVDYYDTGLAGNTAVVVGNEANGVSRELADACDGSVCIPMPGSAESLNAAVAASLIMYEAVRQERTGDNP